jgi:hypothetical protein
MHVVCKVAWQGDGNALGLLLRNESPLGEVLPLVGSASADGHHAECKERQEDLANVSTVEGMPSRTGEEGGRNWCLAQAHGDYRRRG